MSTENAMEKISQIFNKIKQSRLFYFMILLAAVGAVLLGISFLAKPNAVSRASARVVTQNELQDEYGIEVKLIGVTAEGGLVDVRFKILDVEKASEIFSKPEKLPKLITDEGAILSVSQSDPHEYKLVEDGMVFMLFPNQGSTVKPGIPVTIGLGDIHLEPIEAQ